MTSFDPEYLARFGHPFKGWDDPRPTKQCLHCHGTGKADEHNDCGFCFRAPEPGDTVADDIVTIAEFIASEVGFYSPGMVVQAQDLIAWLLERGFAVVAADKIERLRAEAWALAQDLLFMGAEVDKFAGENYEQYCEIQRLRAERDAIDTLHHPVPSGKDDEVCNHCIGFWPCTTHLLLHPEEARRER